jgi:CubicO group peptidase (beta-lactamase class C family)
VHRKAGTWFDDREIYEWFGDNLHRVREPSMRQYVRARELKAAGMDWTDVLAVEDENRRARLASELLASDAYESTAARVEAFVKQGGGCRATFFNYRRYLLK